MIMPLTKQKKKFNKLIQQADSDDSEHELSFYINDRVKLMKEVLKTIRPKKIKAMAPSCLKNMDMEEINSMLLEELLGISNKRLKYIFNGQNLEEESSSSTNEDEPVDIISLDDISDDEFVINLDNDTEAFGTKLKRVKKEHKHRKIKKEKETYTIKEEKSSSKGKHKESDKQNTQANKNLDIDSNENLMTVLELLELQARARAIKSQLLIENSKTQETVPEEKVSVINEKIESDDDVIIENAKTEEIIITSSESEDDMKIEKVKEPSSETIKEPSAQVLIADKGRIDALNLIGDTSTAERNCNQKKFTICASTENITSEILEEDSGELFGNTLTTSKTCNSKSEEIKIKMIENKEIPEDKSNKNEPIGKKTDPSEKVEIEEKENERKKINEKEIQGKKRTGKQMDNDETIVINLSDNEMDELK